MTPADVLLGLAEAGAAVWLADGRLRFRAPEGAITGELRVAAAACRSALIALARSGATLPVDPAAWPEPWREAFEERAGIIEFDGGRPPAIAEQEAERLVRVEHARDGHGEVLPEHDPVRRHRAGAVNDQTIAAFASFHVTSFHVTWVHVASVHMSSWIGSVPDWPI